MASAYPTKVKTRYESLTPAVKTVNKGGHDMRAHGRAH